jgi:2-dehydro-3-deoxygluconokinase
MADPRFDVTSIGEMLLRLSVPSGRRLETASQFDVHPAGAEVNVMSTLARLDRRALWVGALPQNPLGRLAVSHLRMAGVDANGIVWNENGRIGTYYVEFSVPPRGIQVTYDRAGSCMAGLEPDQLDWDTLLDTRLLHLTGITPAISASCRKVIQVAIRKAGERGIPVSFDVNFRKKMWAEKEAADVISELIQSVELLFCSRLDAERLFGCKGSHSEVAQAMLQRSSARHVIISIGREGALLWNGKEWLHEPARPTQIMDRLGAGDALAAGVVHGWLDGDLAAGLRYGVTLSALTLGQYGDTPITNRSELQTLSHSSSSLER